MYNAYYYKAMHAYLLATQPSPCYFRRAVVVPAVTNNVMCYVL